jgi:hypothetical protein
MKGIGRIYQQTFIDTFVVRRPARLSSPNPPRACRARHVGGGVPDRAEANSAATPLDSKRLANAAGVGARATGRAAVTTFGSSRSHVSLRKTLGAISRTKRVRERQSHCDRNDSPRSQRRQNPLSVQLPRNRQIRHRLVALALQTSSRCHPRSLQATLPFRKKNLRWDFHSRDAIRRLSALEGTILKELVYRCAAAAE